MLKIALPAREFFNNDTNEFIYVKEQTLTLEHSLVSVSKWESKWHKPYFNSEKTREEWIDYFRCMNMTQNVDLKTFWAITPEIFRQIMDYINDPMTATTFSLREQQKISSQIITSELVYYWMVSFGIPFECQKWHLNRLMTLIHVCSAKNQPERKMSQQEIARTNRALNEARKKQYHTRG